MKTWLSLVFCGVVACSGADPDGVREPDRVPAQPGTDGLLLVECDTVRYYQDGHSEARAVVPGRRTEAYGLIRSHEPYLAWADQDGIVPLHVEHTTPWVGGQPYTEVVCGTQFGSRAFVYDGFTRVAIR